MQDKRQKQNLSFRVTSQKRLLYRIPALLSMVFRRVHQCLTCPPFSQSCVAGAKTGITQTLRTAEQAGVVL